ncbi:TPA: zinc-ribbon domain-containing protein [Candidatus Avacholeplasma faecigallinarum]|nr:zinc-ribbon domain-containing protein [Candidatus Avacholeplasma faecigallinarum]
MYCKKCGQEIPDGTNYCPNCGANQNSYSQFQPSDDTGSIGWAVLGFLIPIVGLILFLVWFQSKPKNAKKAGIGALISVILSIIFTIIYAVMFVGLVNSLY